MSDKNKIKEEKEVSDDTKRNKKLKHQRKKTIEQSEFEELLDEMLDDENLYNILKKLKD